MRPCSILNLLKTSFRSPSASSAGTVLIHGMAHPLRRQPSIRDVIGLPPRIQIVEVAPRDGLQAETRTLPTEKKLALLDRLADAGHTVIEATSFVSPKAVPQLADAEELMRAMKRRPGVRYPVLVPNDRGLDRAMAAGADELAVFASASESYSRKNLGRSRDEAIAGYQGVV